MLQLSVNQQSQTKCLSNFEQETEEHEKLLECMLQCYKGWRCVDGTGSWW